MSFFFPRSGYYPSYVSSPFEEDDYYHAPRAPRRVYVDPYELEARRRYEAEQERRRQAELARQAELERRRQYEAELARQRFAEQQRKRAAAAAAAAAERERQRLRHEQLLQERARAQAHAHAQSRRRAQPSPFGFPFGYFDPQYDEPQEEEEEEEPEEEEEEVSYDPFAAFFGLPQSGRSQPQRKQKQNQPNRKQTQAPQQQQNAKSKPAPQAQAQPRSQPQSDSQSAKSSGSSSSQCHCKSQSQSQPCSIPIEPEIVHYPSASGHSLITRRRLAHSGRCTPTRSSQDLGQQTEILIDADAETHALKEKLLNSSEEEEQVDEEIEIESASSSDSDSEVEEVQLAAAPVTEPQEQANEKEAEVTMPVEKAEEPELEAPSAAASAAPMEVESADAAARAKSDSPVSFNDSLRSSGIGSPYSMLESTNPSRSESQESEHDHHADLAASFSDIIAAEQQKIEQAQATESEAEKWMDLEKNEKQNDEAQSSVPAAVPVQRQESGSSSSTSLRAPLSSTLTPSSDSYEYLISLGSLPKSAISLDISFESRELTLSSPRHPGSALFSAALPSDADLTRQITAKYLPVEETELKQENQLRIRVPRKAPLAAESTIQINIL